MGWFGKPELGTHATCLLFPHCTCAVQSVEDKIRRWEENPDAELQRKAAAREITVYFNSDVAGAPGCGQPSLPAEQPVAWRAENCSWHWLFCAPAPACASSSRSLLRLPRTPAHGMPWKFVPTQRSVKLHPGQSTLAFYTAENKADTSITGA